MLSIDGAMFGKQGCRLSPFVLTASFVEPTCKFRSRRKSIQDTNASRTDSRITRYFVRSDCMAPGLFQQIRDRGFQFLRIVGPVAINFQTVVPDSPAVRGTP